MYASETDTCVKCHKDDLCKHEMQRRSHKAENSKLHNYTQTSLLTIVTMSQIAHYSACGPSQSVAVHWVSTTDLCTTSQFWLELQLSSIFSSLTEENAGGIWNGSKHVNKGPMTVNYYCRPIPPSPSPAIHNEVSSLIKLIIYFIISVLSPPSLFPQSRPLS